MNSVVNENPSYSECVGFSDILVCWVRLMLWNALFCDISIKRVASTSSSKFTMLSVQFVLYPFRKPSWGRVLADAENHGVLTSTRVVDTEGSITCCVEDRTVGGEESGTKIWTRLKVSKDADEFDEVAFELCVAAMITARWMS